MCPTSRVGRTELIQCASGPPHEKQVQFLEALRAAGEREGVSVVHGIAGRGGGKSRTMVFAALQCALETHKGIRGAISLPSYGDCYNVFLDDWADVVPASLWSLQRNPRLVLTLHSSPPTQIYLLSRESRRVQARARIGRGLNIGWHIADELASDRNDQAWKDILGGIRLGDAKFAASISTPVLGWYQRLVEKKNATTIRWSSYENPWLAKQQIDDFRSDLTPQEAEREIDGKFIALSGQIWRNWVDKIYPEGNRHHAEFDPCRSFFVGLDIGSSHSAAVIVQYASPQQGGPAGPRENLLVVVGEYTPESHGVDQLMHRIHTDYGVPRMIFAGTDIEKRSDGDLIRPSYFIRQHFGAETQVVPITGDWASKTLQESGLNRLILDARGTRRLMVSCRLRQGDPEHGRGVLEMLEQDHWAEGQPKVGEYLPKEGRLEHIRDALLYLVIGMAPPRMLKTKHVAAA